MRFFQLLIREVDLPTLDSALVFLCILQYCPLSNWQLNLQIPDQSARFHKSESTFLLVFFVHVDSR